MGPALPEAYQGEHGLINNHEGTRIDADLNSIPSRPTGNTFNRRNANRIRIKLRHGQIG